MELESECSALESVYDTEVFSEGNSHNSDDKMKNNGLCANEIDEVDNAENIDANLLLGGTNEDDAMESMEPGKSPPSWEISPRDGLHPSKGHSFRKWRRVGRVLDKDVSGGVDASGDVRQGKGQVESNTEPRGERVKIQNDNSHSSMETSSRTSNVVFMQGSLSSASNGKQSGNSRNCDGKNSYDAHAIEEQFSEQVQMGNDKELDAKVEHPDDLAAKLSWHANKLKSESHSSPLDRDPLIDSIVALQSVQEALDNEVRKVRDITKNSLGYNSSDGGCVASGSDITWPDSNEPSLSDLLSSEISYSAPSASKLQVLNLTDNVTLLESELHKATVMLEVKESRISELESTLSSKLSQKKEMDKCEEMEAELENLFQKKIEAEVEYMARMRTTENLRLDAEDQLALFEEQKNLAAEQSRVTKNIKNVESKAANLKKQAEKIGSNFEELLDFEEALKMQKRVCKVTSCLLIQLMLLVLVVAIFVFQLLPRSGVIVPT